MKRNMVMVGVLGLAVGTFAGTDARAGSAGPDTMTPGASAGPRTGEPASTPSPASGNPVAFEQEEVMSAPFTIESIDRPNRRLVVQSPDGARSTVNVSPSALGFDTIKKGDQIELDYYKSAVLSLAPPAGAPTTPNRTSAQAGPAGSRQVTAAAQVTFVDNDKGTIEITTADGKPQTLFVHDPVIRKQVRSFRPGDRISVTYTEPMAVGLRRAAAE